MEYIASAFSGLLSKHRKAVLTGMVVLMLVSYQLQGLRHDGYPIPIGYTYGSPGGHGTNITDADYGLDTGKCMVGRALLWGGSNVRPIIMLSQTAILTQARASAKQSTSSRAPIMAAAGGLLPVFGAADLIAQAGGGTFTYKQQELPLPISNHVRNSSSWIVALDPMVGVLKTITHLSTDTGGCVTIEDSWFAHAAYTGLIVRDIQLTNSLPTPAAVYLESVVMPESFTPVGNITTEKRMKVWSSELSETRSVVLVHSAIFSNITLQPQVSRKRRLLLYAQIVPTVDLLDRAQDAVDRFAAFSQSTTLLKEHEVTWSAMWPQKLIISGPQIESTMTMRAAFYATVYYFLAGRHSMADLPPTLEESHAGCYIGPLLRVAEQWPVLPDRVAALPTYLHAWVTKLAHGGCSLSSPSGAGTIDPSRFIHSLIYGFFGIHVDPDEKTVFISPPQDIPVSTSVEVDAVIFNHHRIQVDLSSRQLNVSRSDLLSEPIFTSAHKDDIIELAHYGTRRVRPLNGVLVANAKQEVDNHWAHDTQHHHTDVHIGDEEAEVQTSSPWGRWLLILLIAAVVGFHGLLMYLVYNEYLAPGAGTENRQTWLTRFKRKHSALPTRVNKQTSPTRSFKEFKDNSATGRRQDVNG